MFEAFKSFFSRSPKVVMTMQETMICSKIAELLYACPITYVSWKTDFLEQNLDYYGVNYNCNDTHSLDLRELRLYFIISFMNEAKLTFGKAPAGCASKKQCMLDLIVSTCLDMSCGKRKMTKVLEDRITYYNQVGAGFEWRLPTDEAFFPRGDAKYFSDWLGLHRRFALYSPSMRAKIEECGGTDKYLEKYHPKYTNSIRSPQIIGGNYRGAYAFHKNARLNPLDHNPPQDLMPDKNQQAIFYGFWRNVTAAKIFALASTKTELVSRFESPRQIRKNVTSCLRRSDSYKKSDAYTLEQVVKGAFSSLMREHHGLYHLNGLDPFFFLDFPQKEFLEKVRLRGPVYADYKESWESFYVQCMLAGVDPNYVIERVAELKQPVFFRVSDSNSRNIKSDFSYLNCLLLYFDVFLLNHALDLFLQLREEYIRN